MRDTGFFGETVDWLKRMGGVKSAVLFGSAASNGHIYDLNATVSSDIDLHLIVTKEFLAKAIDWNSEVPSARFIFQARRPATGGVQKVTAIFASGQVDVVLVPLVKMRFAAFGLRLGLYQRINVLRGALDEMATCLHSGYRFLKGQPTWERFYGRVAALPGVRLNNEAVRGLADTSLCDVLWVFHKLEKGELIAAQHVLHSKLSDTNLRLWREIRRRKNLPLPSFGLGRRIEALAPGDEGSRLALSARLDVVELRNAALKALESLGALMAHLDAGWQMSPSMESLFARFR